MRPQPPRRTTHASGGPRAMLVYDRWGDFGRPVVLLHGLLFNRTLWWPVAAELANGSACTVIAPDLPGHGQTPHRDDYTVERIARDLAILIDRLGLHRAPVIVGHASAGRLASAFADTYATHQVVTIDEPPTGIVGVDELIAASHLDQVPEHYRPYAEPEHDPALLLAYASWMTLPARRTEPAMAGRAPSRDAHFAPLTDPEGFAASLRSLL